jgi:hypothetical protein
MDVPATANMEIRFTLTGDTNLDGAVDVGDLGALATAYGVTTGAVWSQGDSNYDGAVNVGDLGSLATNYGTNLGTGPAAVATAAVAVPEPSAVGLLIIAGASLLRRRRR